jgi:hypothetical protein
MLRSITFLAAGVFVAANANFARAADNDTIRLGGKGNADLIATAGHGGHGGGHGGHGGHVSGGHWGGHGGHWAGHGGSWGHWGHHHHNSFSFGFYGWPYYYGYNRPYYYSSYYPYYYSYPTYYSTPVYYTQPVYYSAASYYVQPATAVDTAIPTLPAPTRVVPTPPVPGLPTQFTVPAGNPAGPAPTFPYDGGPNRLVPLPVDSAPVITPVRPAAPADNRLVSLPSNTAPRYLAYGESPDPAPVRPTTVARVSPTVPSTTSNSFSGDTMVYTKLAR